MGRFIVRCDGCFMWFFLLLVVICFFLFGKLR